MKKINIFKNTFLSFFAFAFVFLLSGMKVSAETYPEICLQLNRSLGSTTYGEDVRRLQVVLGQEGIAYLNVTGTMNRATQNAIKVFQLRNSIRQTGFVGPLTLNKMKYLWCSGVNDGGVYSGPQEISINPVNSSGNNITLAWTTRGSTNCRINGEIVNINSSKVYSVYSETTFVLSCNDFRGRVMEKSVIVKPNQSYGSLPTINLTISPMNVPVGQTATISWSSQGATYCTSNMNTGNLQTSGSNQVLVSSNAQQFTFNCFNSAGQSVSQTVSSNGATRGVETPNLFLTANNLNISAGQPTTLNWVGTFLNPNTCAISGGSVNSSNQPISGNLLVYPTVTTTYNIGCLLQAYGYTGGAINRSVTVTVGSNASTMVLTANPTTITSGQASTLTISGSGISACTLYSGSAGAAATGTAFPVTNGLGSINVYPAATTNYTVTCTGGNGQLIYAYATVNVNTVNSGVVNVTITPNKVTYSVGENVVLTTVVTNNKNIVATFIYDNCVGNAGTDFNMRINGVQTAGYFMNSPYDSYSRTQCYVPAEQVTLQPGQSRNFVKTLTVLAYANSRLSAGNHNVTINIPEISVNAQTNFTVNVGTTGDMGTVTINPNSNLSVGNSVNVAWSYPMLAGCTANGCAQPTNAEGVIVDLINANGNVVGTLFRKDLRQNFTAIGSMNWTIPATMRDIRNDVANDYRTVTSGNYRLRATFFTPSNACFGECQYVNGQQVLSTVYTTNYFNINATAVASAPLINTFSGYRYPINNNLSGTCVVGVLSPCNGSAVLNWTTTNVNYCTLAGPSITTLSVSGNSGVNVSPISTSNSTYTLTCYNSAGTAVSSIATIDAPAASSISLVSRQNGYVIINLSTCSAGRIDWGDGTALLQFMNEGTGCTFYHQYTGQSLGQQFLIRYMDMSGNIRSTLNVTPFPGV